MQTTIGLRIDLPRRREMGEKFGVRRAAFGRHLVPVRSDVRTNHEALLGVVDGRIEKISELTRAELVERSTQAPQSHRCGDGAISELVLAVLQDEPEPVL